MSLDDLRHGPAPGRLRVAAAVIFRAGRVLLSRRPPGGPLGNLWEFPGGKLEPGETVARALERELREELGVTVTPGEPLEVATHDYPRGPSVEVHFVRCEITAGEPVAGPGVAAIRWAEPASVRPEEVLAADRAFLERLAVPSRAAARPEEG